MLTAASAADERATTAHRARLAYVDVRQSSLNQVKQHQESAELQYRLVERAVALGWPHERAQVIDDDLGKSGAGSVERHGFQKLIAESGLGHAGLVVGLDTSRLARNNRDWHQLLELCSVFAVLITDEEALKGIMKVFVSFARMRSPTAQPRSSVARENERWRADAVEQLQIPYRRRLSS